LPCVALSSARLLPRRAALCAQAQRKAASELLGAHRSLADAHRAALAQDRRALEEGVNEAVGTLQVRNSARRLSASL
jgi:hypothetical protein